MFFVGEVVKPSGKGRTATWEGQVGTVVRVEGTSVFVQWHGVALEDQMEFEELVSTGTFQKRMPNLARVLEGSDTEKSSRSTTMNKRSQPTCQRTEEV